MQRRTSGRSYTTSARATIDCRSNAGFAFYDFENAATKKVAVLIFGIFCTWVFAKGPFRRPSPASLLACCAGKRFAFPQLRTLSGSNPMHRAQTKTVPLRGPFPIQWWAMRDVRVRLAPPAPRFVAPLLACCAGKCFAFPQLRTLSGSNPMHRAQTKTAPLRGPFPIQWWAMRDSNPQPCACKAPALTVAPIARGHRV